MDIGSVLGGVKEAVFGPSASKLAGQYNSSLGKAGEQYGQSVDQAMSPFAALAGQSNLPQAQQDYLNQLKGYNASDYQTDASNYQLAAPDVSASAVQSYLDPSIDYQINKSNQATMGSAANKGSLFSGPTGNAISSNAREAAQTGWENAFDKTRTAGLDINNATQSNLTNQLLANKSNSDLYNTQLANAGNAYQTVMSPFEQLAKAGLGKAGTMYNTATTAAGNTFAAKAGEKSPFEQLVNIGQGAAKIYKSFS